MDQFLRDKDRDTILVINGVAERVQNDFDAAIAELGQILDREIKILVIIEKKDKSAVRAAKDLPKHYQILTIDTYSLMKVEKALQPYRDNLLAAVCRSERGLVYFRNVIPHIPFVKTPTTESIKWSTDKISMRRKLRSHDKKISPPYTIVKDYSEDSVEQIESVVGYPCVIKPSGLASSALVSVSFHEDELQENLKKTFKKILKVYKDKGYKTEPNVLVEAFMEGTMYSTDIYVNARGTMYVTPLVNIKTPFMMGGDDFYGYQQTTPVNLKTHKHTEAFRVAKEGVIALGLKSVTAHVELMKTEQGWKIIEIAPRQGGFRDFLYGNSFKINHILNDLLIRLPMRPMIPRKKQGYSMVMKMYAKSEGEITSIKGMKKIKELASYINHDQNKSIGQRNLFARNGGGSIADIYLFNKDRTKMLADARKVERLLLIETAPKRKSTRVGKVMSKTVEQITSVIANE